MSELPLAEQDEQNKESATDRHREASEACDEFFRFRPIAYLRRLVRKADQHNEPQNKAAYYANLACNAFGEFYENGGAKRFMLGAITLGVVVGLWFIWKGGWAPTGLLRSSLSF